MGILNRKKNMSALDKNISFMKLQKKNISSSPIEERKKGNYVDPLIKKKYHDFYNIKARRAVCKYDAIAKKLTYMWAQRVTAKTFKFYSSHETEAMEIMEDIRAKWIELGADIILRKAIPLFVADGYALLNLRAEKKRGELVNIEYDVYGEFECPPGLWIRDGNDKIVLYKVQYIPRPRAFGSMKSGWSFLGINIGKAGNIKMINRKLKTEEVIHIERGEPNFGYGDSLIEGVWDSITKLREESHMEMIDRRLIPTLELSEEDYSKDHNKARQLLKMIADSDVDTARIFYKDLIPSNSKEVSDYPKFTLLSPSAYGDMAKVQTKGIRAGDYGNLSNEWARLCTGTSHTIHYFLGNRAGAVVGSEADKEDDRIQEMVDFSTCEVIIRKILEWLDEQGLIKLPKDTFVIKYWRDWEHIESLNAKAKAEKAEIEVADEKLIEDKSEKEVESRDIVDTTIGTTENKLDELIKTLKEHIEPVPDIKHEPKIIVKHKSILSGLDTEGKVQKAGKEVGWSMGRGTATNIMNIMKEQKKKMYTRVHRRVSLNAEAFGNSIKESYPLFYYEDGILVEEYICPLAWAKNVGKTVPLGVYHDFWGDVELPDWQIVGNAEVFGWDENIGEDFVKFDYNYDKIDDVFKQLNYYDWLSPILKENKTADISTAYYCDIEERYNEAMKRTVRYQVNIDLISISFVPAGNCPGDVCTIQETKANANELNKYIEQCILSSDGTKQECIEKAYYTFKSNLTKNIKI